MTIPQQSPRNVSTAAAGATVFPYDFKILADTDMQVQVNGVTKTLGVHYAVSGVGNEGGGQVVFTAAMAGGETVMRRRLMPFARSNDFQYLGDLRSFTLNNDQDAPIMMLQQIADDVDRSLKLSPSATGNGNIGELIPLAPLVVTSDGQSIESGSTTLTGDMLLRPNLADPSAGKGAALVAFKQSGAGAVTRSLLDKLYDTVSVKDFGAKGDGTTDDSAAFTAALAAGNEVFVPYGTYNVASVTIPQNKRLVGAGKFKTILRPTAAATYCVRLSTGAEMYDIGINGNNQALHCVEISGDYVKIHECHAQYPRSSATAGDGAGYYNVGNDTWEMVGTSSDNCKYSFYNANRGINVTIDRHQSRGSDVYGLYWTYSTQQPQGMRIKNGLFFGNDYAVYFAKDAFNVQVDAIIDGCNHVGIFLEQVTPATSTDYLITCPFITAADYGIQIRGGHNHIVIDNSNISNAYNGLLIEATTTVRTENVMVLNSTFGNNSNNAISADSVGNLNVICCDFAAAGGATDIAIGQTYTGTKPVNNIEKCSFKKTNSVVSTNTRVRNCVGLVTSSYGTTNMPASSTSVVVNHGLARTPTSILITTGGNLGVVWWSNATSTQFTVNVGTSAGVNVPFTWEARCD